ncbi:hypothetical protein E4U55_004323 [Claviceps digitariae]|nr:hypothetical protein E4U55_004323 [Claviceps digitariae]
MAFTSIISIFVITLRVVAAARIMLSAAACSRVHIMVARGTLESPGTGIMQPLVQMITQRHPGATVEPINYPALLDGYEESVDAGTQGVTHQVTSYVKHCPESQVVVLGFSQGAHITGDALCGGPALSTGAVRRPLSEKISSHIAAVVWYGDPRHVPGKSFNKGTATTDGIFARKAEHSCDKYSDILASYCDDGDIFCANRGSDLTVHITYPERYNQQAADFVSQRLAAGSQ